MNNILIIEDDLEISEILKFYLEKDDEYIVRLAKSAEEALPLLKEMEFDLILMDIQLPGVDGIAFTKQLRKRVYCPIIFISCLDDEEIIIKAIEMGGDDYLVKPFSYNILIARIQANIRRCKMIQQPSTAITIDEITLNSLTHQAFKNNILLNLSITEYEILYYLMEHKGEFISFEDLYQTIWGSDELIDIRPLFVHVSNLRKKIELNPSNPEYIKTIQRKGYIFKSN